MYFFVPIAIEKFTPDCSFHRKLWLKHRVNSGKPAPNVWKSGTVTLSEACRRANV